MGQRKRAVSEMWEERAHRYGSRAVGNLGDEWWDRQETMLRWWALRRAIRLAPGLRVLDVGTGTGTFAIRLARRGLHVCGIDVSPTLLRIAEARTRGTNVTAEFVLCAAEDLTPTFGRYDLVLSVTVLQHILDPILFGRAVRGITRVLDQGGRLVLLEYAPAHLDIPLHERVRRGRLMVPRTRDEWVVLFEKLGFRLCAERGVRFVGYQRALRWVLHYVAMLLGERFKEDLRQQSGRRGRLEHLAYSLLSWFVFVASTLVDAICCEIPYLRRWADTRLLVFEKAPVADPRIEDGAAQAL